MYNPRESRIIEVLDYVQRVTVPMCGNVNQ